jgi:uncharacterized protein (DUF58 family)
MLLVDVSASGSFGSVELSKRELAAEVAAILAFSAINNSDKVGLLLFSDEVELFIAPKKGRLHTLRLIREMLYFQPRGKRTNLLRRWSISTRSFHAGRWCLSFRTSSRPITRSPHCCEPPS